MYGLNLKNLKIVILLSSLFCCSFIIGGVNKMKNLLNSNLQLNTSVSTGDVSQSKTSQTTKQLFKSPLTSDE